MKLGYVRDGVRDWPPEKQAGALQAAGVDPSRIRFDGLKRNALKKRNPAVLVQRALMLRQPAARLAHDTIVVAAIRLLAISGQDFLDTLAAAFSNGFAIEALESGTVLQPESTADDIAKAAKLFAAERIRAATSAAQAVASRRRSETARAERDRTLGPARALWPLAGEGAELTAAQIARRVGKSERHLKQHLGPRRKATELLRDGKW